MKNYETVEPRRVKRLGATASFGVLGLASVAYGTQAARLAEGTFDKLSAAGLAALPGVIALGALASWAHNRSRLALAVGIGALGIQCANGVNYWQSKDAQVIASTAHLAQAEQAFEAHHVIASDPIQMQIENLQEEGGPAERRKIRAERRELRTRLATAQATEIAHMQLRVRVTEARNELSGAQQGASYGVWVRSFVLTAIEAAGPAAMGLAALSKEAPAKPAQAPQPSPASLLAHRMHEKRRANLAKAKTLNEAAI